MKDTALVTHIFPLAKSFRNDYFLLQVRQKIANNYKYVKKTNTGQNTAGVKWGCGNPVGILKKERCKTSLQKKNSACPLPRWRNFPSYHAETHHFHEEISHRTVTYPLSLCFLCVPESGSVLFQPLQAVGSFSASSVSIRPNRQTQLSASLTYPVLQLQSSQ